MERQNFQNTRINAFRNLKSSSLVSLPKKTILIACKIFKSSYLLLIKNSLSDNYLLRFILATGFRFKDTISSIQLNLAFRVDVRHINHDDEVTKFLVGHFLILV